MPEMNFEELEIYINNGNRNYFDIEISFKINAYEGESSEEEIIKNVKIVKTERYTILHAAIIAENKFAVEWLLEEGANPELPKKISERRYEKEYYQGWTVKESTPSQIACLELASGNSFISNLLTKNTKKSDQKEPEAKSASLGSSSSSSQAPVIRTTSQFSTHSSFYNSSSSASTSSASASTLSNSTTHAPSQLTK